MFSKFRFKMGQYDNETLADFDSSNKSTTYKYHQVKYYALKMALDGRRIKENDLFKLLVNETAFKN